MFSMTCKLSIINSDKTKDKLTLSHLTSEVTAGRGNLEVPLTDPIRLMILKLEQSWIISDVRRRR